MIFTCEAHKIIMVDTIYFGRFDCLNDQMTWCTLKKACDGKKELLVKCQPFGYFLPLLII